MRKNGMGRRFVAGVLLFTMVSAVALDSNLITASAAYNEFYISESESVSETEDYQNTIPNILEENSDLEENYELEEITESEEDTESEENFDSEETTESESNSVSKEESAETSDFHKDIITNGYQIIIDAADGVFPIGTTVEINMVDTIGEEKAQDVVSEEVEELEPNAQIVKTVTFDIVFYSKEGEIIEPENGNVSIIITPSLQETLELQEIENELGKTLECSVFHVDEELNVEEVDCELKEDYSEISFEAESFSEYVITWYAAPDENGIQETSMEGPKYIGGYEKVPFGFTDFIVPIEWTNDNGETVLRPTELTFTIYGTDEAKSECLKICDVLVKDYIPTVTSIDLADAGAIPVYVKKGTGERKSSGDATYDMEGFKYEVKFHDENTAYKSTAPVVELKTDREKNERVWYASAKTTITSARKELANASFKIEWYDNHNENRQRPYSSGENINDEATLKTKVALYYYTSANSTPKPVSGDMMPAGATETGPMVSKDSYSTWSVSYKNLLPKDEDNNDIFYVLKLSDDFAPQYASDSSSNDYIADKATRKYSLLGKFAGQIQWNDGGMADDLRPGSALRFVVKNGNGDEISIASEDIIITGKTDNIWEFEVDNLIMYSDEGIESYYVTLDDTVLANYEVSYTNAPKSTDVTKCHDGGKIFVTLKRNLNSFTIHKKWIDNNSSDRSAFVAKGVTLYLWRYPVKKVVNGNVVTGTIEDGAPVNDAHGEQYSYRLTDADSKQSDFVIHFDKFVGSTGTLEMYDTQGYEYVYYVTEIMGGDEYVTSYSNINTYTHIETAVADGGTLINLRKESIKIEGIVRWRVPSVTDYTKASATISLQRYDENSKKWVNVGSPVIVSGFTEADPQKRHVFPAVDKYDDLGREIKYRVIETNINYNGVDISVNNYKPVKDADNNDIENNYVADDYVMNGFDYTATAHPTWQTPVTEAEKYSFTVDNRMSGDVNLDIIKIWKTKEKYGAASAYSDITISIIQKDYKGDLSDPSPYGTVKVEGVNAATGEITPSADGKRYATLTVDGKATKIPITVKDNVITPGETNLVWTLDKIKLPEFDSEGRAYTYSIKEDSIANTRTSYEYSFDGRDIEATVSNSYAAGGGGEYLYFEIEKEWIDGADLSQRQPVTVAIVSVNESTGEYSLEDNAGETHEYVLSAENNWHQEVWLSKYLDEGKTQPRFNTDIISGKGLWTVIEEDVSLKAEYEKLDGIDFSDEDGMDVVHRKVEGYPTNLISGGIVATTSIDGKVAAIVHNDLHKPGYEVKIEASDGGSVFGAQNYKVTNKRVGKVNVEFDKTWHDSENKANTRGKALRVKLYQNDTQIDSAERTYTYSASGNGSSDIFNFNNLPKYDTYGVAYQYSVREFMVRDNASGVEEEVEILTYDTEDTTLSGYVADIEGHEAKVTFDRDAEKQIIRNEVYKYSNTLTGKLTTGVPFYVVWHDQSSYENGGRPDMYFTLYYRTIGDTHDPVKYEGDYKVIWETVKEGETKSNPYYKYATFTGLPAADEKGNAYEFFAAPSLNNAADHYYEKYFNDHKDAILQPSVVANESTGIHHYDISATAPHDKIIDLGDKQLIPVGGLVEYIIHEEITPKGKKTWKNVDQGITAENLPNVKVYLGRYSSHDIRNKMYDENVSSADFLKAVDETTLDTAKLSFDFGTLADGSKNTNAPYPKYDDYGQIYTYQLAEKIYVNSSNSNAYEVPNYIMEYNPDSLNLVNTYLKDEAPHKGSRSITVNKNWAAKTGSLTITGQYPQARFKLYRMEVDPANCVAPGSGIPYNPTTTKYDQAATDLSKFIECGDEKVITYSTDVSKQTASWVDMPIYAPSGRPYLYLVKETDEHGMSAYTITNNGSPFANGSDASNRIISGNQVLISNFGLKPDEDYNYTVSGTKPNQQSVVFTNTLNNNQTISKITGEKVWTDSPYSTEVRPNPDDCNTGVTNQQISLVLKRTAKSQTGASNAVTKTFTEGEDYKVTWAPKAGSDDVWVYTIEPLIANEFQTYAPNGQLYTYTVTEKLNDVAAINYKATAASASRSAEYTSVAGTLEETTKLRNALKGQIQLFKLWDDALNEFKLRSGYVDVILQYREVSATNYTEGSADSDWTTYTYKNSSGVVVEKYTLNPGNKWKLSVSNLPIKNKNGSSIYEYRVLEMDFNDHTGATLVPISSIASVPNGYNSVPSYKNSTRFPGTGHYETKISNYTVNHSIIANLVSENIRMLQVENFLSGKAKLYIEKKWDGIQGKDVYGALPEEIIYKVQYSTNKDDESSWKDLYDQETGALVTATVEKNSDWQLELRDLHLITDGKMTYYRAIELGTNLGRFEGYAGEGRPMSEKTTSKPGAVHEHYYVTHTGEGGIDSGSTETSTTTTNTLATRNLTVKKKWNDDASAVHGDVDIELWSSNYNNGNDGTETFIKVPGTSATLKASEHYEFTYHNLPLRNNDGKNIVYYIKEVNVDGAAYDGAKYDNAFFVSTNGTSYSQALANSNDSSIASIDKNGGIAKAVCIVNTPKTTLRVTKKWNDENNRHRLRKSVSFKLTDDNGGLWTSIPVGTSDGTYSFERLPIYKAPNAAFVTGSSAHMAKVTYTVTEENYSAIKVGGYKSPVYTVNGVEKTDAAAGVLTLEHTPSATTNNVHILNEMNPPKATITADKLWKDEDNRHGSRTSQIDLSLYYRVGTTSGNWTLITKKPLNADGNYPNGNVYTTSDVTQSLTQNEVSSSDSNKWLHTGTFATWKDLPTVKDGKTVYYKVFETKGKPSASVSASYTGDFTGYEVTYSDVNGSTFTSNGQSKNQTVTNTLKRTEILVEKEWRDKAEQKIRPYSVTFEIEYKHAGKPWKTYTENGQVKKIVVTGDHNSKTWTQIVGDLPFADSEGYEYEYRLKEVSMRIKTPAGDYVDVYDQMDDDGSFTGTTWKGEIGTYDNVITVDKVSGKSYNYKFTAVNTPDVGSITVTKVWDDNNNRDGLRPNNIKVTLYRDGKEYAQAEIGLSSSGSPLTGTTETDKVDGVGNKWTYTWKDLPMYKDNAGVHDTAHLSVYYVVEDSISVDPVLNYKPATYGLLEDSITTINATHIQSHVTDNTDTTTDLWIKNTHDPIRFKIDAYKKWDDNSDSHKYRPTSINLKLQYRIYGSPTWIDVPGGVSVAALDKTGKIVQSTGANPQTVSNSNAIANHSDIWEVPVGWDNLPARIIDTDGKSKLVEYKIVEEWLAGDSVGKDHYESEMVPFHYDYEEAKAILGAGNHYPEEPLVIENLADYNSILTVVKKWNNQELLEKYGALPKELHVKLQKWDGTKWVDCIISGEEQVAVLQEHEAFESSWTHSFQELIATDTYRVIEEKIVFEDGLSVNASGISYVDISDKGNGSIGNFATAATVAEYSGATLDNAKHWVATLTNSLPNRKIEVTKNWDDEGNRDELRPERIYVTLQRDGKKIDTVVLDATNSWTHEWGYLPLYKDGSDQKSAYSVIETDAHGNELSLEGYEVSYDIQKPGSVKEPLTSDFDLDGINNDQKAIVTITNTHKPVKTTVHAIKQWDDWENKYGERPNTIYLALFYKYQHELDSEWRLIDQSGVGIGNPYVDSLIHTTSDPVQIVTGDSFAKYWDDVDVPKWDDLPSQAVVNESGTNVIRIPEYRVVEVNAPISITPGVDVKLSSVVTNMGGDITKVVSGYTTTQPEAFFVSENGGVSDNQIVINELETVSTEIIKKWDDQNNRFANRPIRIDFAIQKKKGAAGSWELLTEKVDGKNVEKIVSLNPEMLGDDDNTWILSVDGLPKYAVGGERLSYRAVEVSLVYADKTVSVFAKDDYSTSLTTAIDNHNNGYKTEESVSEATYQTTIKNTQDKSAKVSATKVWNDYDNARKTRPLSVVFAVEKRQVHDATVAGIIATIKDFFKENGGWEPVYELNGAGERTVATITLDGPDFDEASLKGLPLYNDNGKELVYRAREIKLIYENRTVEITSGGNPYQAPSYVDDASVAVSPDTDGITHYYRTEATNKIKPDPPAPPTYEPVPDIEPEIPSDEPPETPPIIRPEDPDKPDLPPELDDLDEEIENIEDPEDIIPIIDELIDIPDSPERDYVVKKLWEIVKKLAEEDPTFYDNFDPEMRDILREFVRTGVLGKRRSLPKTGGLGGSLVILLIGFTLIGTGIRIGKKGRRPRSR